MQPRHYLSYAYACMAEGKYPRSCIRSIYRAVRYYLIHDHGIGHDPPHSVRALCLWPQVWALAVSHQASHQASRLLASIKTVRGVPNLISREWQGGGTAVTGAGLGE